MQNFIHADNEESDQTARMRRWFTMGLCVYITNHRMVGYVFAVPVGLVISSNLSLILAVVVKNMSNADYKK